MSHMSKRQIQHAAMEADSGWHTADSIVIWITRILVAVAREGPMGKGERYRAAGDKWSSIVYLLGSGPHLQCQWLANTRWCLLPSPPLSTAPAPSGVYTYRLTQEQTQAILPSVITERLGLSDCSPGLEFTTTWTPALRYPMSSSGPHAQTHINKNKIKLFKKGKARVHDY